MQPRVNVIFHYRDLVPPRKLQYLAPRRQRHRRSRRILKVRRKQDELDAIRCQRGLQRFQIQTQRRPWLRLRPHRNGQAPRAPSVEDPHRSRIRRVFHNHGIARTHKRFADQIEGLLASIGDEQIFIFGRDTVVMQHLEQRLYWKELLCRARHHKRERVFRHISREAAEDLLAAFIGEEQFPPDSPVSIQDRRRRRRNLKSAAVSFDERAASHVALNQPFRFQLGVSVRHRGAVNAKHGRELRAGRDAVARAQIARVDEGGQLIAKLDVQRNVTLRLEMEWKHCLSPSANSTRYWTDARANLSSPSQPYVRPSTNRSTRRLTSRR